MTKQVAIADATADTIDQAEAGVREVLREVGDLRQAAIDEATPIFDQIRASARGIGEVMRSAKESSETAVDTAAESVRRTRDLARTSADVARSTAEEAAAIAGRTVRTAAAMSENAKDALDDVTASVERARQVVGDAIGGSAAERLRGPRTSRRMRLGLLVGGLAGGAAATYFLDSDRGSYRRQMAIEQFRRWSRRTSEAIELMSRELRVRLQSLTSGNVTTAYLETTTWEIDSGAAISPEDASAEVGAAEPIDGTE